MRGKIRTYQTERKEDSWTDAGRIVRHIMRVFALFICSILCGCTRREQLVLEMDGATQAAQYEVSDEQEQEVIVLEEQIPLDQVSMVIFVHVCGAVKNPGVYELDAGSRVYEAIKEAGGFTENADESYVNLAQQLTDGIKIIIPTTEQTESLSALDSGTIGIVEAESEQTGAGQGNTTNIGGASDGNAASDGKININTASEAELCNIPGIGVTRAAAIVAYRQEKGGFTSIEDIMNVSGIKEGTYDKIKDRIKVN